MYKHHWIAYERRSTSSPSEIIKSSKVFENWDKERRLDDEADAIVQLGLESLYSEVEQSQAIQCFEHAHRIADRWLHERRFEDKDEEFWFPLNRGIAKRVIVYTRFFIGREFDGEMLAEAARDVFDWCDRFSGHFWDDQSKAYCLSAVRAALIGGDQTLAKEFLKRRRIFTRLEEEYYLLKVFTSSGPDLLRADREFLDRFETFFDTVRDPLNAPWAYTTDLAMTRFELGILREYLDLGRTGSFNWRKVIEAVSR